jgi:hypothetical protein
MHHFVYPSQDTFISSVSGYEDLNFGLNEILRVGVPEVTIQSTLSTKLYPISTSLSNFCLTNFSGSILNATLYGTASHAIVSISSSVNSNVSSSNFSGILTGSYWSASVSSSNYTGSLGSFSGSFSGIFSGSVSGSIWTDYIPYFKGSVLNFTGKIINGYVAGWQNLNQSNNVVSTNTYSNRALLQFDLSAISQSIASGNISNISAKLVMKCAREENLPIRYSLIAYPINQSWVMGDGYFFDGGSLKGASWIYRDYYSGSLWSTTGSSYLATPSASQMFNYEAGDVSMDVTTIVNGWINGTFVNNGLVVISSEETSLSGSGMSLYFFSRDTNTIYSPHLDVSWNDSIIITGSIVTGSIQISTINSGITASIQTGSTFYIPGGGISGKFSGDAFLTLNSGTASGIVIGLGETGNITNMSIIGNVSGITSLTSSIVTGSCGKSFDAYLLTASFINGPFSGSTFGSYYTDYKIENGILTGSWSSNIIFGNMVTIPIPSGIEPFAYAYVNGTYVYGKALGQYTLSGSNSASFVGQFIDGNYIGGTLNLELSGTINTQSYDYTSSVIMISSSLSPMQVSTPFITVVRLPEKVKNNQIIKVNVFGREQYPLKNFQRLPQFSQYLTPLYLPSSSFYAIKDNVTEEIILDFDNYTRLSCDTNGSYFMLDASGLPQERYFKVLIKVEMSGSVYVVDNDNIFKVVR